MNSIVQNGDPVLRQTAKPVTADQFNTPALVKIIANMSKALASEKDGVAIAAPQIGLSLRIFLVSGKVYQRKSDREANKSAPADRVFINPKFIKTARKKMIRDEGCLSCRWWYGKTKRSEKATIEAYDEQGKKFTANGAGLMAQIFQHETDHLNGILFVDHATELKEIVPSK